MTRAQELAGDDSSGSVAGTLPNRYLGWSDVVLLGIAAAFSPLDRMANNVLAIAHPERVLSLILIVWLAAVLVVILLSRRGVRRSTAVYSTFLVTSLVMAGGGLLQEFGTLAGWAAFGLVLGAAIVLISRTNKVHLLRATVMVTAVVLAVGPVISFIENITGQGQNMAQAAETPALTLTSSPDIFLVVVDGYAGLRTLDQDFGLETPDIVSELEGRGFELPLSAWSSYPSTRASVPSLLDMSYPLEPGEGITPATDLYLSRMIGGSNSVNAVLGETGYETVMVESGWSGSFCTDRIDRCVSAPLLDEMMFSVLARSIAGPTILETFGYSFTVGSQRTMSWLLENAEKLTGDEVPSFVFAHVMAPHPPFFLDESCRTSYHEARSGVFFTRPNDDLASRQEAYLDQVTCVNRFMIELTSRLQPEDVVVFVGDHGSDARHQLVRDPSSWTEDDLRERYNVFLAVRGPAGCSVGSSVLVPNVFRRVLSCLSDSELADLPPRMMKYAAASVDGRPSPILEVGREELLGLLDH